MLRVLLICCIATISCSINTTKCFEQVNLYTNLAQVKQSLDDDAMFVFTAIQSTMINTDLITIEGCENNEDCKLQISTTDNSLVNSDIVIKNPKDRSVGGRRAILKNSDRNLVHYIDDNTYAYVEHNAIEYLKEPTKKRIHVSVKHENSLPHLNLTFITRQILWQTEHELDVSKRQFISNVVIKNLADEMVCMQTGTTLLTRHLDISSSSNQEIPYARFALVGASRSLNKQETSDNVDNLMGVRKYTINHSLSVPAKGSLRFKLKEQENWSGVRLSKRSRSLYDCTFQGRPNQVVRFNASSFIPTGNLNVKDDGWIIHRTSIPSISKNEQYDIDLGQNADIVLFENIATSSSDKMSKNISVNIKISNFKAKRELVEYELLLNEGIINQYNNSERIEILESQENRILFCVWMNENEINNFKLNICVKLPIRNERSSY